MSGYKKREFKRKEALRDSSLIVIAAEGTVTEVEYFENFVMKENFYSSRVRVEIVKRDNPSHSSPDHVLKSLEKIMEEFKLNDGDVLWLLIDVDRWPQAKLSEVATKCYAKNINMAVSNPCFEVWLLSHFKDLSLNGIEYTSTSLCTELRDQLGSYNKSINFTLYKEFVETAIINSRKLDTNPTDRWPQSTGTHVYKLAESILNFYKQDQG